MKRMTLINLPFDLRYIIYILQYDQLSDWRTDAIEHLNVFSYLNYTLFVKEK